jgi:hypothetical protein
VTRCERRGVLTRVGYRAIHIRRWLLTAGAALALGTAGCSNGGERGAGGGSAAGNDATAGSGDAAGAGEVSGGRGGFAGRSGEGGSAETPAIDGGDVGGASGGGAGPADGGAGSGSGSSADDVWSPLQVMVVVDPLDHGAVGDGIADDLGALQAAVAALPEAGGIVYLREGRTFRKTDLLIVDRPHIKLWAINRGAELLQLVDGTRRRQSILCRQQEGCGVFGLHLRSDANERFDALEDNPVSADGSTLIEVVGCEVEGAAASGIFLYGSSEHYIHGNFIHHTWADHVHHTDGAQASWVWRNFILNEEPSRGDDGVACVTYGPSGPRCRDMEWWSNTILHTGWGRGYSVIGGEDIFIHDNWAIGVAGAGIIVASEGSYDSASSTRIRIERNVVYQAGHSIGHPGILISGLNEAAEPLTAIALVDNVSVDNPNGPYRAEGAHDGVTNDGLRTDASDLPEPVPTRGDVVLEDTSVLRTRDVSHVPIAQRAGLHRIHVRPAPDGSGFEQRFEYVVSGEPAAVAAFCDERSAAGDFVAEQRSAGATAHALLLTAVPVAIPEALEGVSFRELREHAAGMLDWLWTRIDAAQD